MNRRSIRYRILWVGLWLPALCAAAYAGNQPVGSATAPAPTDTAVATLAWPAGGPGPERLLVWPDSLLLGQVLTVGVDIAGPVPGKLDSLLQADRPWLAPDRNGGAVEGAQVAKPGSVAGLPDSWPSVPEGKTRLIRRFRVYGLDPFRVALGDRSSPVVRVGRRLAGGGNLAPVRDPRPLGWSPARWLLWTVGAVLLALCSWWWWRRRKRAGRPLPRAALPLPGWLEAACGLEDLLAEGWLERGEHHRFLDGLAGLIRGYLSGRYLIGARQMTAPEILAACRDRGYDTGPVRQLVAVMTEADRSRYQPRALRGEDCRRWAAAFFRIMAACRIMPVFTPVPAELSLRAGKAWSHLDRELASEAVEPEALRTGEVG